VVAAAMEVDTLEVVVATTRLSEIKR